MEEFGPEDNRVIVHDGVPPRLHDKTCRSVFHRLQLKETGEWKWVEMQSEELYLKTKAMIEQNEPDPENVTVIKLQLLRAEGRTLGREEAEGWLKSATDDWVGFSSLSNEDDRGAIDAAQHDVLAMAVASGLVLSGGTVAFRDFGLPRRRQELATAIVHAAKWGDDPPKRWMDELLSELAEIEEGEEAAA